MSSTEKIKSTIKSTAKTKKITGAMELVAASKLGRTQKHMAKSKPFSESILEMLGHIASSNSEYRHPLLQDNKKRNKIGYIVVSSDRGLCGGLNQNLFKTTLEHIGKWPHKNIKFCLLGNKANGFFSKFGADVLGSTTDIGDNLKIKDVVGMVQIMLNAYLNQEIDAIFLCYNQFKSTMNQQPIVRQLAPIVSIKQDNHPAHWDYIYEPEAKDVIESLAKRYIESMVYQAAIENVACEQASRMIAMKNATDNAQEIIDDLKLIYNKVRQAAITQELAEIIGGAGAV